MRFQRPGVGSSARGPHPPEHNLIQRPDLAQALARLLGIRQPHITPALNEGVQAVVVLGDISREPVSQTASAPRMMATHVATTAVAAQRIGAVIENPSSSLWTVLVRRVSMSTDESTIVQLARFGRTLSLHPAAWTRPSQVRSDTRGAGLYSAGDVATWGGVTGVGTMIGYNGMVEQFAGGACDYSFDQPFVIEPGQSFLADWALAPGSNMNYFCSFTWDEVAK